MRKSKAEAAQTHEQIVGIAANEFRLNGITATGIVPLMAKAGLTQGGFYKHFSSKDQLVAEACTAGIDSLVERFKAASAAGGEPGFKAIVDSYLSEQHRQNREEGCPLAAMGSELVRTGEQTRLAATEGFTALMEVMAANLAGRGAAQAHSQAMFAMAAMIGAVTMARIMPDQADANVLLNEVRRHLSRA
jgi:TetR/AcrR family transcriptional repressor of nem operon